MYHCDRRKGGRCLCPDCSPKQLETFEPRIDLDLKSTAAPVVKHQPSQASKQIDD